MKELTQLEISQVSGGALPGYANLVIGGGSGVASNVINNKARGEEVTAPGLITSFATGLFLGSAGGAAIKAAGGGVAGNVAWRPGFIGLNALLQRIIAAND